MTDFTRQAAHPSDQPTLSVDTKTSARSPEEPTLPRPRIRFGAIAWGMFLCVTAATTLWISTDAARRVAFGNWLSELTPGTVGLLATLILGALLLILGALAAIRRSQERGRVRR
jgi:hypothetical protein